MAVRAARMGQVWIPQFLRGVVSAPAWRQNCRIRLPRRPWRYQSGLVAEGTDIAPPTVPHLTGEARHAPLRAVVTNLEQIVPSVTLLLTCADDARLEGGWVYAAGRGSLSNPASTLHRRDRIGITQAGSYISVDTGKYSTAPWLAREVVRRIPQ